MSTNESELFTFVETLFISYLHETIKPEYVEEENICCNETEKCFIKFYAKLLKTLEPYKKMSKRDIFLTLIYIYYSLNLNEPTADWLTMHFLKENSDNELETINLYVEITSGDIQINISSCIRRQMMGL
jgi:hypothetical protein